jgi:hypothetical protein
MPVVPESACGTEEFKGLNAALTVLGYEMLCGSKYATLAEAANALFLSICTLLGCRFAPFRTGELG